MIFQVEFAAIDLDARQLSIEYQWIDYSSSRSASLMIFLHEGLGSVAMWKDFPRLLCETLGCRGLVYSRPGYGRSTARAENENWDTDFMHRQAHLLLPALLEALEIDTRINPPWLFGHSDGGSIALLYAAEFPERVAGMVVLSPHIMVEDISISSIEAARKAYLETDLKQRLTPYHADPDSAFRGWNDIWLHPSFREWSIEAELEAICCPVLAVQGLDDEYGTLEQVHGIARRVANTEVVELAACGHSPHRDRTEELIRVTVDFLQRKTVRESSASAENTT
jgi:pimeloyl-ACP methyl ester carboxylesterase